MTGKFGISQPVRRREDFRFVTGQGRYADDINVPGQAHAAFLRSDHPHGRLRAVDTSRAAAAPGVLGVFTGADLRAGGLGSIPLLPLAGFDLHTAVDDVGTVINPMIVHGQVQGGVAQGIGQVLMEHCRYDEDGQMLTGSFMDYAMPRADDLPGISALFHPVPSPKNPLGVKGAGECGVTGSLAAVMNAIVDVLAQVGAPTAFDMPATPEKVWRALRRGRMS